MSVQSSHCHILSRSAWFGICCQKFSHPNLATSARRHKLFSVLYRRLVLVRIHCRRGRRLRRDTVFGSSSGCITQLFTCRKAPGLVSEASALTDFRPWLTWKLIWPGSCTGSDCPRNFTLFRSFRLIYRRWGFGVRFAVCRLFPQCIRGRKPRQALEWIFKGRTINYNLN